jgi:preprotein translocase subunit SecE
VKPLLNYFAASRAELAKVTWPSRRQTLKLTIQVIVFSLLFAAMLGAFDYGFQTIIQKLIIKG